VREPKLLSLHKIPAQDHLHDFDRSGWQMFSEYLLRQNERLSRRTKTGLNGSGRGGKIGAVFKAGDVLNHEYGLFVVRPM
jgi:hypothetical protein